MNISCFTSLILLFEDQDIKIVFEVEKSMKIYEHQLGIERVLFCLNFSVIASRVI